MNKHLVSDSNQRPDGIMHGRGGGDYLLVKRLDWYLVIDSINGLKMIMCFKALYITTILVN